jgi:hypothetical protein
LPHRIPSLLLGHSVRSVYAVGHASYSIEIS